MSFIGYGDEQAGRQAEDGQGRDDIDHGFRSFGGRALGLAQEDQAEDLEQVEHRQDGREKGRRGEPDLARLERAHDHEELREEAAERRDADDGEGAEEEGHGRHGHRPDEAAHLADVPLVGGVDDDAGAEEKAGLGQAVHEDEEERAGDAGRVGHAEAEEDIADLADRRVGQDALEVVLHGGRARGDEARKDDEDRDGLLPAGRELEAVDEEAGEGVDADLDQDGGVEQGRDRRRGDAGVREPRVERHRGRLREHAEEDEEDGRAGDGRAPHGRDVEGVRGAVDLDEAEEHDHGAEEGHQEGLVGLDDEVRPAVEADEPPAADGDDLPEEVEEDQVAGEDEAHHRADEEEDHQVVFVLVLVVMDVAEGVDDDEEADERGNAGHEDGQGVEDEDEVEAEDERPAEDPVPAAQGERDERQGQDRRRGADQDGPGRSGRPASEVRQGDRERAEDGDEDREEDSGFDVHGQGFIPYC